MTKFLSFVAVIASCVALSAAFVFPLWKWALGSPKSYTAAVLLAAAAFLAYSAFRAASKMTARQLVRRVLKILIPALGIFGIAALVMLGRRILALPVLAAACVLYGVVNAYVK